MKLSAFKNRFGNIPCAESLISCCMKDKNGKLCNVTIRDGLYIIEQVKIKL